MIIIKKKYVQLTLILISPQSYNTKYDHLCPVKLVYSLEPSFTINTLINDEYLIFDAIGCISDNDAVTISLSYCEFSAHSEYKAFVFWFDAYPHY